MDRLDHTNDARSSDIARGFVGVVVNSNYSRSWAGSEVSETAEEILARYVAYPVLAKAMALKVRDTARRRLAR